VRNFNRPVERSWCADRCSYDILDGNGERGPQRQLHNAAAVGTVGFAALLLWLSGDWHWVEGWIIEEKNLVRGQFRGYRDENGVAKNSQTETFAAVKLEINSWRWKGVPFYIRAGKCLPTTCTEIVAKFHKPPTIVPDSQLVENHLRLRLSPEITIAMGMMNLAPNAEGLALQTGEMVASHSPRADEMDAYERVLGAAMDGDSTLFAHEDYVEEAWRIVDPILKKPTPVYPHAPKTWGPQEVERVTPPAGWSNPGEKKVFRVASEAA